MFDCYLYILAMVTSLFLDFTVHFDNFITLEDGWLESTIEILLLQKILVNENKHLLFTYHV